ncbi:MAG TPA: NRDE family protein [Rhodanobacteraceae bacterium]|nr:NRDE family protein [Rhodanobacteraceae bacterium]
MCLLLIALDVVPQRPVLLLGNRDEFHARPSAPAAPWAEAPQVVGGRDLEAGGSWLALRRDGRFAAVTNVRLADPRHGPRSRGALVRDFVLGHDAPDAYVAQLRRRHGDFAPFNLVVGDARSVWCLESPRDRARRLAPGVHLVSNGPLDAPWPKMERLRAGFCRTLAAAAGAAPRDECLLDLLRDATPAADAQLPDTGIPRERERLLSAIFVRGEAYGTRASTLAWRAADGGIGLVERRFGRAGAAQGETRLT